MPNQKRLPLVDAIGLYHRSREQVRSLKAKLPADELGGIVQEVLNRVKSQGQRSGADIDAPSPVRIEKLCYALISDDEEDGQRFIETAYDEGASIDALYLRYLAEAASMLGDWWDTDHVSFTEVALGTTRIYAIMRSISYLFVPTTLIEVKSAVFAAIPDETHTLGIRMAADLFGKEGWDIDLIVGRDHDTLIEEIAASGTRIIGLSAGGAHSAAALARVVLALRISNPAARIFLSGQITRDAEDVIAAMDLDGVAYDVPSALSLMDRLWEDTATLHRTSALAP